VSGGASQPRPHRPAVRADLTALIDEATGGSPANPGEVAAATAAAVLGMARGDGGVDPEVLLSLADRVGLDTLAELWRDSDPVSLPGALWALYLLRQWCHGNGEELARLWRLGEPVAAADAVVAGVGEYASAEDIARLADAVLTGAFRGDFAVALERAAAVFRVVASGRREQTVADADSAAEAERATRNDLTAANLIRCAALWRRGALQ
jgi:hypothetical protein